MDWIREKTAAAVAEGGPEHGVTAAAAAVADRVVSVSLSDLREGGPTTVRQRLAEAKGGCVVVNAVEERDLQVSRAQQTTAGHGRAQHSQAEPIPSDTGSIAQTDWYEGTYMYTASVWYGINTCLQLACAQTEN